MSRRKKAITVASTETREGPQNQMQKIPQDATDDNPLACIDYACEAISSAFDSFFGKEEKKKKQTDRNTSTSTVKVVSDREQVVVATDAGEKILSLKKQKVVEESAVQKAVSSAVMEPSFLGIEGPKSTTEENCPTSKQRKSTRKKSSKKRMQAVFGRFFKKSNAKASKGVHSRCSKKASPPKLEQSVAVDIRKAQDSQPDSTKELHIELEKEETPAPIQSGTLDTTPAPLQQLTREISVTKNTPRKVSFGPLPEILDIPPSPTTVASDAFFHKDNLSAAKIVPLDSDSESEAENDDSEVESLVDEASKQGTFDVVKDMNEMWQQKEEVISELNEMWQEADQDLVKVISAHISFDEDDHDEPLESDYVLERYERIVAAEQKLTSFQPQPQIIAAV